MARNRSEQEIIDQDTEKGEKRLESSSHPAIRTVSDFVRSATKKVVNTANKINPITIKRTKEKFWKIFANLHPASTPPEELRKEFEKFYKKIKSAKKIQNLIELEPVYGTDLKKMEEALQFLEDQKHITDINLVKNILKIIWEDPDPSKDPNRRKICLNIAGYRDQKYIQTLIKAYPVYEKNPDFFYELGQMLGGYTGNAWDFENAVENVERIIQNYHYFQDDLEKFKILCRIATNAEIFSAFIDAHAIYRDDIEKMKAFFDIVGNSKFLHGELRKDGAQLIRAVIQAQPIYSDNLEKLKLFCYIRNSPEAIEALAVASPIYGDDIKKMTEFVLIGEEANHYNHHKGSAADIYALISAHPVYGDDFEKLQQCADIILGCPSALPELLKAQPLYADDPEKYKYFMGVRGNNKNIQTLAQLEPFYEDDFEKFKLCAYMANFYPETCSSERLNALMELKPIYGEELPNLSIGHNQFSGSLQPRSNYNFSYIIHSNFYKFPICAFIATLPGFRTRLKNLTPEQIEIYYKILNLNLGKGIELISSKRFETLEIFISAEAIYGDDNSKMQKTFERLEQWGLGNFKVYAKLVEEGVITGENDHVLDKYYIQRYTIKEVGFNETIIRRILELTTDEEREEYLDELEAMRQKIISSPGLSPKESQRGEIPFLTKTVFPKGNSGNYETNEKECEDQTAHLAGYKFNKKGYPIQLSGLLGYQLKEGQEENIPLLTSYQERIQKIRSFITQRGPNNGALQKDFEKKIDEFFEKYADARFKEIQGLTVKEKMLCIFISQILQKQKNPEVLDLLVEFKYVYSENLENYIQQSADDVKRQRDEVSQHRALWMELGTIYGENMKHVMRHDFLNQETQQSENVRKIVDIYGSIIGATAETPTLPKKQLDRIHQTFENDKIKNKFTILKKQAFGIFGLNINFKKDEDFDEKKEFMEQLDEIMAPLQNDCTLEEFLKIVPNLYALRTRYRFDINGKLNEVFTRDYSVVSQEIAKYDEMIETEYKQTEMGGERGKAVEKRAKKRKLRSFFMKSKESSNARMGAYLCIAGDTNMWKNKNYFELVTKDEETGESRGVVMLLNIETKDGKRYLWFGPNPYESLLTQIATKPMYDYLYKTITDFAAENKFDGVVVPEESQILGACTNRGGEFPDLIKQSMLRDKQRNLKEVDFGEKHMLGGSYGYSKGVFIWKK